MRCKIEVIIEYTSPEEKEKIIIRCHHLDSDKILQSLNARFGKSIMLLGKLDKKSFKIDPKDIYYIESVEGKVFLYAEHDVFESKQSLQKLEELLRSLNCFIRSSRTVLLNIEKVESFYPVLGGKQGATLKNGEKALISRRYVNDFKQALKDGWG